MAAALLMMNMQGAVMAADKDQTIFRYSDKVPFALITDPNSSLPWADIWNEFRINSDLSDSYLAPFKKYLKSVLPKYSKTDLRETAFCVYFEPDNIFVTVNECDIQIENNITAINIADSSCHISSQKVCHVNWLGDLNHMGAILGDSFIETSSIAKSLFPKAINEFRENVSKSAKNEADKIKIEDSISDMLYKIELNPTLSKTERTLQQNLNTAINSYHIEDMVRVSENLIDSEAQLQHLQHPNQPLTVTKEIATMTLAEGFRWIKHSLYGA